MLTTPQTYLTASPLACTCSALEPLTQEMESLGKSAIAEVREALATERPGFRYGDHWYHLAVKLTLLDDADSASMVRDWRDRGAGTRLNITLHFDITSKDNFTVEWTTDSRDVAVSLVVSGMMGYHRPNRLVQLPLGCELMGFQKPRRLTFLKDEWEAGWRLLIRAAHYALTSYFARLSQVCNVATSKDDLVLFEYEDLLLLRKVERYTEGADSSTEHIEAITGFLDHTLLLYLPVPDWRNPSSATWDRWCTMLVNAGGRDPRRGPDATWQAVATDFYRRYDRDEQEAQSQVAQAEQQRKAVEKVQHARDYLKTLTIGHRSGWHGLFAKEVGLHTTDVKRWMRKNLPDMFEQIYPPGSTTAQPLRSPCS